MEEEAKITTHLNYVEIVVSQLPRVIKMSRRIDVVAHGRYLCQGRIRQSSTRCHAEFIASSRRDEMPGFDIPKCNDRSGPCEPAWLQSVASASETLVTMATLGTRFRSTEL